MRYIENRVIGGVSGLLVISVIIAMNAFAAALYASG